MQIGRNRMTVIERMSKLLGGAVIQVWLIEKKADRVETRLAYFYPITEGSGHRHKRSCRRDAFEEKPQSGVGQKPSKCLWILKSNIRGVRPRERTALHSDQQPDTLDKSAEQKGGQNDTPLAWAFACKDGDLEIGQLASAKILGFTSNILNSMDGRIEL